MPKSARLRVSKSAITNTNNMNRLLTYSFAPFPNNRFLTLAATSTSLVYVHLNTKSEDASNDTGLPHPDLVAFAKKHKTSIPKIDMDDQHSVLQLAKEELARYFDGELKEFRTPVEHLTGTEFQRKCWAALQTIPFGSVWDYSRLAEEIGSSKAVRAVGSANGSNPIPIFVPCHRVIGKDKTMRGYGMGGEEIKLQLLELEKAKIL
ncbi:hypothetical protein SmJEL517_g01253 [Synchytrium microbalum]|uniref:Methylated-DNA--protein-cysteine methyltransferase n=1 Tax=Synchytrium microbalum TaxID=1806994 RepID=A0A507C6C6_9FUNG|nr:uncharacterized protein SmJEL517_g01253 [Synchytrium microbalum]TPX36587.1 hypothetical protein SmJEL517_g01253 [Synchytrium microbalum]